MLLFLPSPNDSDMAWGTNRKYKYNPEIRKRNIVNMETTIFRAIINHVDQFTNVLPFVERFVV